MPIPSNQPEIAIGGNQPRRLCDAPYFAALWMIIWIGFFPGFFTADSMDMLWQAATGRYNDIHSPLLSFLWSLGNHVMFGPASLTLFGGGVFFTFAYLILVSFFISPCPRMILITAIAFWPPILNVLGSATKEIVYVGLMTGVALCFVALSGQLVASRAWRLCVWLLFYALAFLAVLVRPDGVFAVAPVIAAAAMVNLSWQNPWRRLLVSLLVGLVSVSTMLVLKAPINHRVFKAAAGHPEQAPAIFDIAGISLRVGQNLMPAYVTEIGDLDLRKVASLYKSYGALDLLWPRDGPSLFFQRPKSADVESLHKAWWSAVTRCFPCYVRHRARFFEALLGVTPRPNFYAYQSASPTKILYFADAQAMGVNFPDAPLTRAFAWLAPRIVSSGIFSGWPYLIAALLLVGYGSFLGVARGDPSRGAIVIGLAVSSISSFLGLSLVAPEAFTRFLYWPIVAVILASVAVIAPKGVDPVFTSSRRFSPYLPPGPGQGC